MEYGFIVLANSKKGFVPQAIKWFTKSQFSHSFVTIPNILGAPICIEAAENGVDVTRFDTNYIENPDQAIEVWQIKISQEVKDQAIKQLLNDLEIGYGFLQYPWFMWRRINAWFGRDIKAQNNWNTDGFICSQLCVVYLKALGLEYVLQGYGNGSIAPEDLRAIFRTYPEVFTVTYRARLIEPDIA